MFGTRSLGWAVFLFLVLGSGVSQGGEAPSAGGVVAPPLAAPEAAAPPAAGGAANDGIRFAVLPRWPADFHPAAGALSPDGGTLLAGDASGPDLTAAAARAEIDEHRGALACFDADGRLRQVFELTGPGSEEIRDVAPLTWACMGLTGFHEGRAVLDGQLAPRAPARLVQACVAVLRQAEGAQWLDPPVDVPHRWSVGRRLVPLTDGSVLVVGEMEVEAEQDGATDDGILVFARRYLEGGRRDWFRTWSGRFSDERGATVSATPDGGFVVARRTRDLPGARRRTTVTRHDAEGREVWSLRLPETGTLAATHVTATSDGGAFLTAWFHGEVELTPGRRLQAEGSTAGLAVRVSKEGQVSWARMIAAEGSDGWVVPLGGAERALGGFELVGHAEGQLAGLPAVLTPDRHFRALLPGDGHELVLTAVDEPGAGPGHVALLRGRFLEVAVGR